MKDFIKGLGKGAGVIIGASVALLIACICCCLCAVGSSSDSESSNAIQEATREAATSDLSSNDRDSIVESNQNKIEKQEEQESRYIGINDEFGNNTIKCMIQNVNLDYQDDSDYSLISYQLNEKPGFKAIRIDIKMSNVGKSDNYVSAGDFDCYADNVVYSAEALALDGYNENIAPGRDAIIKAVYFIPEDTEKIELEYHPLGEGNSKQIIVIQ